MHNQAKIESSGFCPSFSFYSSDTSTSTAVAKVIREEQQAAQFHEFGDFDEDDFEFSVELSDEDVSASAEDIDSRSWTVFPVFNRDLLVKDGDEAKLKDSEIYASDSDSITGPLCKLFIDEREEYSSSSSSSSSWSSSESNASDSPRVKCKKSSSTGSGSKRWSIRYLLRRSNSEGKVDTPKQKRNSGEVSKVGSRLKVQTPVHEQFYVQRRAEKEIGKRKSYLPYRQDLVGLFSNVNRMGKMLPF